MSYPAETAFYDQGDVCKHLKDTVLPSGQCRGGGRKTKSLVDQCRGGGRKTPSLVTWIRMCRFQPTIYTLVLRLTKTLFRGTPRGHSLVRFLNLKLKRQ